MNFMLSFVLLYNELVFSVQESLILLFEDWNIQIFSQVRQNLENYFSSGFQLVFILTLELTCNILSRDSREVKRGPWSHTNGKAH